MPLPSHLHLASQPDVDEHGDGLADLCEFDGPDVAPWGEQATGRNPPQVLALRGRDVIQPVSLLGSMRISEPNGRIVDVRGTTWITEGAGSRIRWALPAPLGRLVPP